MGEMGGREGGRVANFPEIFPSVCDSEILESSPRMRVRAQIAEQVLLPDVNHPEPMTNATREVHACTHDTLTTPLFLSPNHNAHGHHPLHLRPRPPPPPADLHRRLQHGVRRLAGVHGQLFAGARVPHPRVEPAATALPESASVSE